MLVKHVAALVRRDMAEVINASVFEHELEILKDIHGEGNIELAPDQPDNAPFEIDATEEFGRLMAYYGENEQGQPYVERVFGRTARGLEAHAHRPAKKTKAEAVAA